MRAAYIAGPYAAETQRGIASNIRRALAVGRLAALDGFAPIVPHAFGSAIYGSEGGENGHEVDERARWRALAAGEALAYMVGEVAGVLYVIPRPDGSLSEGTELEQAAYIRGAHDGGNEATIYVRYPEEP